MDKELKLTTELVPRTSWFNNMRKIIPRPEWDRVRKGIYAEYGHRCGICRSEGRLNCHEVWLYDDQRHIQKLKGFIALCDLCHHVKHLGLASILALKGELNYARVVDHFMKVNDCDRESFEKHREEAFRQHELRSQYQWKVDLGEYERFRPK